MLASRRAALQRRAKDMSRSPKATQRDVSGTGQQAGLQCPLALPSQ